MLEQSSTAKSLSSLIPGLLRSHFDLKRTQSKQVEKKKSGNHTLIVAAYGESSEKAMAPHPSTLAWKIPWTEEPGRLQCMGSLRVGKD